MSTPEARTIGHYRLRSLIGRGATSEVYAAQHLVLGDVVAIKLLRAELADDAAQVSALADEGAKVRAIDHPNVVRVLDAGIDPATRGCYLVMEHVAGEPLAARLRREGPLPEAEVRRLGAAIADGVAAAHARGIVHRDLKPANVMLDGARPKIVDFGIARVLGSRSALTTGRALGTLAYMAPEQLASGMIAPCTDIWALGVILFEAATGRLPFEAFQDGRCPQLFDEPTRAATLASISPALDSLIARCLERDPARRPASAAALAALLRGVATDELERVTADVGPLPYRGPTPGGPRAPLERVTVDAGPPIAARASAAAHAPPRRRRLGVLGLGVAGAAAIGALAIAATTTRAPTPAAAGLEARPAPAPAPFVIAEELIEIEPEPAAAVDAGAAAGIVHLRSKPAGARVFVDGRARGVTPLELELELPGEVELQRRGYLDSRVQIERAGTLNVILSPARRRPRDPVKPPALPSQPTPRETLD